MHKCPKCGQEFDTDFCPNCGRKWQKEITCPKCGTKNSGSSAFCGKCGYQLVETKKTKKHKNDSEWFKKHKKPILITVFSAVALVAVILVITMVIIPIITNIFKASKVSEIEIGYTQEQVRQILGDPYESQSTNTKWQYFDGEYAKILKELDENDRKSEQALLEGKFDEIEKLIEHELELTEKLERIVCKYIVVNYQLEKNSDGVNEYVVTSVLLDTQFNNSTEKNVKNYQLRKGEVMLGKSYCNISYSTYFTDGSYYLSSVDAKVGDYDTSTYNTAYVTWSDKYYDLYELEVPVAKGYEINGNELLITADAFNYRSIDNMDSITSIVFKSGVKSISQEVFRYFTNLTSVTISDTVTEIGEEAFYFCYSLIEIKNLSTLNITAGSSNNGYVGYYAKRVYSEGKSYLLTDENGYIIYDDGTDEILVGYVGTETQLVLPSDITIINNYAFDDCSSLTSVIIPDSVKNIGNHAFEFCNSLTSITIGNGVTSIGSQAFYNCHRLIEVKNLSLLTITAGSSINGDVGYYAKRVYTEGDSYLSTDENGYIIYDDGTDKILVGYVGTETQLVLPSDITIINNYAFDDCSNLTSVTIPDSVTRIGDDAFDHCDSLTSVTIGNGVTSIGKSAFYSCSSLTSVTIPDSVTSIGSFAFYNCNLTSVAIPDGVTSIGRGVFESCSNLKSVTFENTSGWWYSDSSTVTSGTSIASTDLADPSTAATYLKSTYCDYFWKRS